MMRIAGAAAVCLAVLAAGCGGTGGVGTGASDLVPATAPAYFALDTNPSSSQWKTVDSLASRFPDKQKAVEAIKKDMRRSDGIDWNNDVKPALGDELDVVWLDFANGGTNVVALTKPHDEKKFAALVQKANAHGGGTKAVYDKFKGWEVVSDSRAKIDRFERESSSATSTLSDESSFNHAMTTLGSDSVVRAYVNGSVVMNLLRANTPPDARKVVNKLGTLDWLALRLGATSDGIALDTIAHGTPGSLFKGAPHTHGFTPSLTKSVPQDALAYATFHGSKNMLSGLRRNPVFSTPQLRRFAGVLEQIGTVLQGENAVYAREPSTGRIPEVTFVAAPGAGVDGAATLDRLLGRFRAETGVVPKRTTIAGTQARTLRAGPLSIDYADVNGKLVVTDVPQGIRGVQRPGAPLAQSGTFNDAKRTSGMPNKTQGFLYVNIHSTIPAVERLSQTHLPSQISRNLKPLHSAVEYVVARSREVEVSFFLRIK